MGIIFVLKRALHLNHPLSVAATVKDIIATRAQKRQVEKMRMRGHEDEDRLFLFWSQTQQKAVGRIKPGGRKRELLEAHGT